VFLQNPHDFFGMENHIRSPQPEPPMLIDSLYPLIKELPLAPVLLGVLPLHFQYKVHSVRQPNQEIGPVFLYDTLPDVENLKA
jgi:hypothetical protein